MRLILVGMICTLLGLEAQIPPSKVEPHRSPVDVAVLPDGRRALTANHTAGSVSLVDLDAGKVLAEAACGKRPAAVACSADGRRAAVSNLWSGTVSLFEIERVHLRDVGQVNVGHMPRGLIFAPDGKRVFTAVSGQDEVVEIDWSSRQIRRRWPAPREPRHLALSRDGCWLAAASSRSGQVRCWDLTTGKLHLERTIEDAFNLRGLAFTADDQSLVCAHVVRREFPVSKANIEEGWVIDSRLTRLSIQADALPNSWQIALDTRGQAVGDPHGITFAQDNKTLVVAAGGTHELLLLAAPGLPWNAGDPGDFLDLELTKDKRFRRVPLGGRPLAVAVGKDPNLAVVANYLLDSLQVVDVAAGKVVRSIHLGAPAKRSLARKGEALFYDARRSHNQWFSCHTCHVEGHTCGLNFDTLNDDSYGTPKLTPSLYHVTKTGPWTWHGIQKDLGAGIIKSTTQTMFGPKPSQEEVAAMLAFLETLTPPPNPHRGPDGSLGPQAERGQKLFHGKAACSRCHRLPYYTSTGTYDVKLEADGSPYKLWNPPSLIGLYDRGPYMHDGRAKSLDELLQKHHTPPMVGGEPLNAMERADLIAFLKSL